MVVLDVGVGDRVTVGVGVDEQDLTARGGLESKLKEAFPVGRAGLYQAVPPASAGGTDGVEVLVRRAVGR
jgi:hypothetical protein